MLSLTERKEIAVEQVSLVLGQNYVISFQENGSDVFQPVRERLRGGKGRLRPSRSDYLLYALIDAIVDQYFAVLEAMGEKIEAVQQVVVDDPQPETLNDIHALKRQLLFLRRAVWPLRDVMNNLSRSNCNFLHEDTKVFFRDVYDHVVQIIDVLERDLHAAPVLNVRSPTALARTRTAPPGRYCKGSSSNSMISIVVGAAPAPIAPATASSRAWRSASSLPTTS